MRFVEGYKEGYGLAKKFYEITGDFESAKDPRIDVCLANQGIKRKDVEELCSTVIFNSRGIGKFTGYVAFLFTHGGTIHNSGDIY